MKYLFFTLLLLAGTSAGAQQLGLDELIQILENRRDTAFQRTLLKDQGFDRNATVDKNQVAFMGDVSDTVKRFTEIVFLQSASGEVQLIQYCTRHQEVYKGMLKAIRANRDFRAQPIPAADEGEFIESFTSRSYDMLLESVNKKTKYVISIWIKGAKL
ncbi:hypothetical protein [Flaviaesturariibacter amylovorans]|uniref:DUF4252 domain-containing protein n=1 Tax=Flaviaesturariibacter amylovorans TaxID=1084520 RepID=A0ABP8HE70_9BACT